MDFSLSEQYTLSIRLRTDGFSFVITSPLGDDDLLQTDYQPDESLSLTANLKQAVQSFEWWGRPFRKVQVLVGSKRFTLLPLELFEDEQAEEQFHYNHPRHDHEQVMYNILQRSNLVVIFGIDSYVHHFVCSCYPEARFYAQSTPLIEYFAGKSHLGNSRKLYVHLAPQGFEAYAYDRGRLLLGNHFDATTTADVLYFILYIWKQLDLAQERDELHLAGDLSRKEQLLPELRKYIRQVYVMNPAQSLDFQSIHLCE